MCTGVEIALIASAVVAAAGTSYGAYTANEAAGEQRDQYEKQKAQAQESALVQREQASAQMQQQVESQRSAAIEMQAAQNAAGAASGIQLSPGTSLDLIEANTKASFDKALQHTFTAGEQTQANIQTQLNWTTQKLDFEKSQLPSTGSLITQSALSTAGTTLNAYSNYLSQTKLDNLLEQKSSSTSGTFLTQDTPN